MFDCVTISLGSDGVGSFPDTKSNLTKKKETKNTLHWTKLVLPSQYRRKHHLGELKVGPGNESTFGGGVEIGVYWKFNNMVAPYAGRTADGEANDDNLLSSFCFV